MPVPQNVPLVAIDNQRRFQRIDGFGATLSGSSVALLGHLSDRKSALLRELFSDAGSGIGLSYIRISIGASDFSTGNYTYDDVETGRRDSDLAAFSVGRDAALFTLLREIEHVSKTVRIIASPWSAPAWMKSSQSLNGGTLEPAAYDAYARYLVRYVAALRERGITLDALTPQNEPLLATPAYPSMLLTADAEAALIADALGPRLHAAFPATKLVINDHNWDATFARTVLIDPRAARYVAGSAYHCYAGDVSAMSELRAAFPAKTLYLDECSGGAWSPDFGTNLAWDARQLLIGSLTNWAQTVLLGNVALADAAGPVNGGCRDCRGVVTIHADGSVSRNVEYYVLAHAAKLIRPGAVRVKSTATGSIGLLNVAFENADGSTVLIVFNAASRATLFAVRSPQRAFFYTLPAGALATFRWPRPRRAATGVRPRTVHANRALRSSG